jgi:hypothetical protein
VSLPQEAIDAAMAAADEYVASRPHPDPIGIAGAAVEAAAPLIAAAEGERIRMRLLGCAICGLIHDRRGPLPDHGYRPRYLASPNVADLIREQP